MMNDLKTLIGAVVAMALAGISADAFAADKKQTAWTWIDGTKLPIEGKAFADTERYYDRLPAQWSNDYTRAVWGLQRCSAGLAFRFVTDADRIRVRWSLTSPNLSMPHMPSTGMSGVDVYQYGREATHGLWRDIRSWHYCAPPFPSALPKGQFSNEYEVAVRPGLVTMVYLPTYNGIRDFALALPAGKSVKPAPARASGIAKPVVFYGTSTTQGGCTSRPAVAWPSIVGQEADVPIVNLGFSGAGKMEDVMVDVLARIDASLYVLDTIGNMDVGLITNRYEKFVRALRAKRPGVPIMLTLNKWIYTHGARPGKVAEIYEKLKAEDPVLWKDLTLGGSDAAFCADRNFTVDGCHLNDWGAWHVGRAFAEDVRVALGLDRPQVRKSEGGMKTPWGEKVTAENAWHAYPRPQLVRGNWTNLNGLWDYAVVAATDPMPTKPEGKILVPFAFESVLSGVGRDIAPTDRLWYRRTFTAPTLKDGERFVLRFDGVDWRAQVFVNGCETLDVPHEGPLPFAVDATDWLKAGENVLELLAWDPTGTVAGTGPCGKQTLSPAGCAYHRVSGIWQTVWAEVVPATHLASYRLDPDLAKGAIRVKPILAGDAMNAAVTVDVLEDGRKIASAAVKRLDTFTAIPLPKGWETWSPAHPKLYDLQLTVRNAAAGTVDSVKGYFGMRQVEKRRDAKGFWRVFLNGEPIYLMGLLDQGYWPDGLWTPPSDEAMAFDVSFFRNCGFNMARKHLKVEPLRWYHHCDRQGLIVIQDLNAPAGSKGIVNERRAEAHDRLVGAHRRYMAEAMDLLGASPCVIAWAPYNEGGAEPWSVQTHATLAWTKRRDPTRLVDAPSGWVDFDGGGRFHLDPTMPAIAPTAVAAEKGDILDMHHYPEPSMRADGDRISFLGEWGGIGLKIPGHLWAPDAWGYCEEPTVEAFEKRYLGMVRMLEDLAAKGLSGSVYTQATDCEREANGLITYDRRVPKVNPETVRAAHERVIAAPAGVRAAFVPDAMAVPKPGAVKPAGWLREWSLAAANGYTGHMTDVDEEFVRAWRADFTPRGKKLNWWEGTWSFEGGAYWFDGLVRLAFQLDDPALKDLAKKRLDPVLDHMNDTSIGFCWWLDRRDTNHWAEVRAADTWMVNWVAGMFARPVSAWYEATGDARAKKALAGALGSDYWVRGFASTPTIPSGAYEAWRLTGEPKIAAALAAFADCLATNRTREAYATAPANGLEVSLWMKRRQLWDAEVPPRHGVITQEDLLSVFAAYRATGNRDFLATVRAWYRFLDKNARLPFGATVMDEEWGHAGPGRGTESCALAAEEWSRLNLLAALGEGSWGDDVERAFFNAAPAMTDRAWRNHVYFQVPNRLEAKPVKRFSVGDTVEDTSATYARKHSPLCCTAGLNRVLPNYVQAMWMKTSDGGVAAALYGPSTVELDLPGGRFAAAEKTDYPFAETIAIEISAAPSAKMPLKLRIPAWCAAPTASVNGRAERLKVEKGFVTLARAWRTGDKIALAFPMKPRVDVVRDLDETQVDYAYVSAGPILFARGYAEKDANQPSEKIDVPEVDPKTVLDGARVNRAPLAKPWDWPLAAPFTLTVKDAAGKPLQLVPYGCTKLRASMFPVSR